MFGFTSGTKRGNGNRWVEADVENLSKTAGLTDYEEVDYDVYAADYIGKYVFFATLDGIYAAPQEGLSETSKVASFDAFDADEYVADMAFNVKDSKLYLLTNHLSDTTRGTISSSNTSNTLYTVKSLRLLTLQLLILPLTQHPHLQHFVHLLLTTTAISIR